MWSVLKPQGDENPTSGDQQLQLYNLEYRRGKKGPELKHIIKKRKKPLQNQPTNQKKQELSGKFFILFFC